MTQKQVLAIAADEEAMDILKEISHIQFNMSFKTAYEQKTAKEEMKQLAKEFIERMSNK